MNTRPLAPVSSQPLLGQLNFQELIIMYSKINLGTTMNKNVGLYYPKHALFGRKMAPKMMNRCQFRGYRKASTEISRLLEGPPILLKR